MVAINSQVQQATQSQQLVTKLISLGANNVISGVVTYERSFSIDLTDYSRSPNGLLSMFPSFSLTSARKGDVPTFSAQICFLLSLTQS